MQNTRSHYNRNIGMYVRPEERKADTPVGIEWHSKRIFKGEIRNQSCALLLLDFVYAENDKNQITQSVFYGLGVFFHARK